MDFIESLSHKTKIINRYLDSLLTFDNLPQNTIFEAMRYSVKAGGKRIRPVLALSVSEAFGRHDFEGLLPYAAAIELIHTYSLIHDDLPCMDNDDLRRGKPTSHKVFGEAIAVLAGDALLNYAFETIANTDDDPSMKAKMLKVISRASGIFGMIGGQVVDIESEGKKIDKERLLYLHNHKTGELIRASVSIGAIYAGKDENIMSAFSKSLGLAFQIKDDILDVEGNCEKLGKKTRKDGEKSTFVTLFGLDVAKEMLKEETNKAVLALEKVCADTTFLKDLAYYLLDRQS
ncbi:MAG: polyprenyl synthetase family protein [Clostridiaceae bacterium]|nr:polyprenyl synthetase family protein [Clostridiaceae bacterium]